VFCGFGGVARFMQTAVSRGCRGIIDDSGGTRAPILQLGQHWFLRLDTRTVRRKARVLRCGYRTGVGCVGKQRKMQRNNEQPRGRPARSGLGSFLDSRIRWGGNEKCRKGGHMGNK
jgi:hypothetical protein